MRKFAIFAAGIMATVTVVLSTGTAAEKSLQKQSDAAGQSMKLLAKLGLDANLPGEKLLERLKERQEEVLEQLARRRDAELVRELAGLGYAPAQFQLGTMYLNGNGVIQDFGEAEEWFRRASDQRHERARGYWELAREKRKRAAKEPPRPAEGPDEDTVAQTGQEGAEDAGQEDAGYIGYLHEAAEAGDQNAQYRLG